MAICTKCQIEKNQSAFENYKRANGSRGWRRVCHACRRLQTNPDKLKAIRERAYEKMGREKWAEIVRAYREKRKQLNLPKRLKESIRAMVFEIKGRCCAYCLEVAETIDHVVPLSRGGGHDLENLVPACKCCNSAKGNKLVAEWRNKKAG